MRSALRLARRLSTAAPAPRLVLGAGSNVVDLFFPMMMLPRPGDKTYFANEVMVSNTVVGGVTLNHLAWARALGVPTGLMALQGADAHGATIRAKMAAMGVSADFVRVAPEHATSVSHILSGPDGERTILMAPASTSRMTGDLMRREFAAGVARRAAAVTTEISQLPLSGVEFLLDAAASAGVPSLLDVDVTPAVATGPARLGSLDELRRCVLKAGCLKLTASAAGELLALVSAAPLEARLENVAQQLADAFGSRLCVVTDGSRGSALALGRRAGAPWAEAVRVPVYGGVHQIDATGAGDAFFGGIVACVFHRGFPANAQALSDAGAVAAAAGAACVEIVGALPVSGTSAERIEGLCGGIARPFVAAARALDAGASAAGGAGAAPAVVTSAAPAAAFAGSLRADGEALAGVAARYAQGGAALEGAIRSAVQRLRAASSGASGAGGAALCSGVGKSGAVAARLAMSLRSIGVRSGFVHGAEWAHGDLGGAGAGDTAVLFSHSGRTPELVTAAALLRARGAHVVAVTGCDGSSALARAAHDHLPAPARDSVRGAPVPARSIVAQEAVANALVSAAAEALALTHAGFLASHPAGAIGNDAK
jgi:D-arabinose 5-phosphate isomerase GutQ/sugar/nucleoside kinase (ribokinase family)